MKVFGSLVRLLKESLHQCFNPPPFRLMKTSSNKAPEGWDDGTFFKYFSWIQKKSCNPGLERMAVCYHWEQPAYLRLVLGRPLFCYHWPGFPRFLNRLNAEVTTASLQMSRDLGLKGRAREVDSKQLWGFFKTRKIPDKGKVKIQKSQKKIAKASAWNC